MLDQNRSPQKQLFSIIDKSSKIAKGDHEKILKFVLYHEINSYLKQRIKLWKEGIIIQNAGFYSTDLLSSLIVQAKIENSKKMSMFLNETIFAGREDLQRDSKKWMKRQEEEAMGRTSHFAQNACSEENSLELNHFIGSDLTELKTELATAASC